MPEREHGDRSAFLGRLRERLAGGVPRNLAHPAPPPPQPGVVPEIGFHSLDEDPPLADLFEKAAARAAATVERVTGREVPKEVLEAFVTTHGVQSAVVSAEREAIQVGEGLAALGVEVTPYEPGRAAVAEAGVTSARAGIATTGSVVVDSALAGGRGASLVSPVHLCVLPVERLLRTPGDLWRRERPDPMPSGLVVITGPSRTGDIEQIITIGVHGPIAVHIILTGA